MMYPEGDPAVFMTLTERSAASSAAFDALRAEASELARRRPLEMESAAAAAAAASVAESALFAVAVSRRSSASLTSAFKRPTCRLGLTLVQHLSDEYKHFL